MPNGAPSPTPTPDVGGGLSAEDQAFIAQEKARRAAAPPPPPAAPQAGKGLFREVVDPLTRGTAHVISGAVQGGDVLAKGLNFFQQPGWVGKLGRQQLSEAGQAIENIPGALEQNYYTPAEQLPTFAQEFITGGISPMGAAQTIVPQTKTAAAIDAASLLMPEAKLAEAGYESLSPMWRILGSRPGRMATQTAVGAIAGKLSGEGAGKGAFQGAVGSLAEPFVAAKGYFGRKLGEPTLEREGMEKFGRAIETEMPWMRKAPGPQKVLSTSEKVAQAIKSRIPFLGKTQGGGVLENGRDFALQFRHKFASKDAANVMNRVINDIEQQIPAGTKFDVGLPQSFSILHPGLTTTQKLTFREMNNLIHDFQSKMAYGLGGEERGGLSGQGAMELAHRIKDNFVKDLNALPHSGKQGLGDILNRAKRKYDITRTMEEIFSDPKLITRHGLDTNRLVNKLDEYAPELARGFGNETIAQDFQQIIKRGFLGAATDVPGEPARAHVVAGGHFALPHMRVTPGAAPRPVGQLPGYMRPSAKKYEVLFNNLIGKRRAAPHTPAVVNDLDRRRSENIVGPGASAEQVDTVHQLGQQVASGSPNVQADLNSGRMSLGHVRKVLDSQTGSPDEVFRGLSPQDAISTLASASSKDKEALYPSLVQYIQNTGGNMSPQQRQQMLAQLQSAMA